MKLEETNMKQMVSRGSDAGEHPGLPCVGRLVGMTASGDIAVRIGSGEPTPARLMAGLRRSVLSRPIMQDREVLVMFERGDPSKPIILGLLADPLEEVLALSESQEPDEIMLDGKKITLEAQEEILLKCGKASIQLLADGSIRIRGTEVLNRASGTNRIRGGNVQIN